MPFYIIKSDYGFCGTDEEEVVEADSAEEAENIVLESMQQNLSAYVEAGFDTEEEAHKILDGD